MSVVLTLADVEQLQPGQWVKDADGDELCLVDTHLGFPQRMWLIKGGTMCVALDQATFPVYECDIVEQDGYVCPHRRTNECGHCYRCGRVVGEPRPMFLDDDGMRLMRAAGAANARAAAARAEAAR